MEITVRPAGPIRGTFAVPGDKSISHRALMISAISEGSSTVEELSDAVDPMSTLSCLRALGVEIDRSATKVVVRGKGLRGLREAASQLDAGNSGTTMRLLAGILCGQYFHSTISGDESLNRRPMRRVVEPLRQMGAHIESTDSGTAPLKIYGGKSLRSIQYTMPVASAQVKSSILLAGLYAEGVTEVLETTRTRDHTERMLGLATTEKGGTFITRVRGSYLPQGRSYVVPGDFSAAAFLIVGGLIVSESDFVIKNVGLNPTRTKLIEILRGIGAQIDILDEQSAGGEPMGDIRVRASDLEGNLEVNGSTVAEVVDEIPALTIAALFCKGTFSLRDAKELRVKESDRLKALVENLRLLGVAVDEYEDGFAFVGKNDVLGGTLRAYGDHRIAMAMAIAGLRAKGSTVVQGAEHVQISFPRFWEFVQHTQT